MWTHQDFSRNTPLTPIGGNGLGHLDVTTSRRCRSFEVTGRARMDHGPTTAAIYSHAIRGEDHAAAQSSDGIMQRARAEKSTGVN
jgi:hypothetical protein